MQDYVIGLGDPVLQILEVVHNYDFRPIFVIPQKTKIKNKIVVIKRRLIVFHTIKTKEINKNTHRS